MKLTFKQYLESKTKLKETVALYPIHTMVYEVTRYCAFPVGHEGGKRITTLRPRDKIVIEWQRSEKTGTFPVSVSFMQPHNVSESAQEYSPYWSPDHVIRWLEKNTNRIR